MHVHKIADPGLANSSYLVGVGRSLAVAVDPPLGIEEHLALADRLGWRIVAALETHLHADFISGSRELAEATGAEAVAPAASDLRFGHRGVSEGDRLRFGDVELEVLATPGHTPEHVSYVAKGGGPAALFSGGSLIGGGAARTDLIAPELTEPLARDQFRSLRRLAGMPDDTTLHPTHGAGSFCAATPGGSAPTTLGAERRVNALLAADDEERFVRVLVGGYGSYPRYYLALREVNRAPVLVRELAVPKSLAPLDAAGLVSGGAWLVDARPIDDWARRHAEGSVSIRLRPGFEAWLGWVVPFGAPVVFMIDEAELPGAVAASRKIGYDRILGWVDDDMDAWEAAGLPARSSGALSAAESKARMDAGVTLVDVRQRSEWELEHIPQAVHLEVGAIAAGEAPESGEVVVHCAHGERSATAASLLERSGIEAAYMVGGIDAWKDEGLDLTR